MHRPQDRLVLVSNVRDGAHCQNERIACESIVRQAREMKPFDRYAGRLPVASIRPHRGAAPSHRSLARANIARVFIPVRYNMDIQLAQEDSGLRNKAMTAKNTLN